MIVRIKVLSQLLNLFLAFNDLLLILFENLSTHGVNPGSRHNDTFCNIFQVRIMDRNYLYTPLTMSYNNHSYN